jgi:hypothetical protein
MPPTCDIVDRTKAGKPSADPCASVTSSSRSFGAAGPHAGRRLRAVAVHVDRRRLPVDGDNVRRDRDVAAG